MKKIITVMLCLIFASCSLPLKKNGTEENSVKVVKIAPSDYPDFSDDYSKESLNRVLELNLAYLKSKESGKVVYNFGEIKITPILLKKTTEKLKEILSKYSGEELNNVMKEYFDVYKLVQKDKKVVFSSYYEPMFEASLKKDSVYKYPIYKKPEDMVDIDLELFDPVKYKGQKLTGRVVNNRVLPYYDRDQIDYQKILEGKGLELAYLKDPTDVMDLHIQGSGILKLPDGKYKRAKFAATNSLRFKGWMSVLIEFGLMDRSELTLESAKRYIRNHPEYQRLIFSKNRRYTFFNLEDVKSFDEGPIGTYGLNLVAQRSIAIDNSIIPLGTPAFINVNLPEVDEKGILYGFKPSSRFVFCHDTGGAIKGMRVDFFAGTGDKAKGFAYSMWEKGDLYLIVLKFDKIND